MHGSQSHSFACKQRYACLYLVSIHQMAMHDWLLWWQQRGGPASDWHSSVLHENVGEEDLDSGSQASGWKPSYASVRHRLCQFWCMGARLGPPQSTCSLALMHLKHGHYARSWGYRILATYQMRKSEEPLVVHRFLTWWLIDVCGSSAILLAFHLARTTTKPLQRLSDKYILSDWQRPAGRSSHTWLRAIEADLGPLNFALATAWRKATTRDEWRHIVNTATLQWSTLWKKERKKEDGATTGCGSQTLYY